MLWANPFVIFSFFCFFFLFSLVKKKNRRDFNDVSLFDLEGQEWLKVPVIQGKAPEARSGHTASNHDGNSIFYFGGWNAGRQFNDLHILELNNLKNGYDTGLKFVWSNPDISMGLPRWGHSGCSVKAIPNWRMFIFGGANSSKSKKKNKELFFVEHVLFCFFLF